MFDAKPAPFARRAETGRDDSFSLLSNIALLAELPAEELHAVEHSCHYRRFAPQEQIIERGARGRDVYFLVRGRARAINYSLAGREIAFGDIVAGMCFGELPALDNQPQPAAVIAVEDSLVLALQQGLFQALLARHPCLALRLLRQLSQTVRDGIERVMDLSTLDAQCRVQAELLRQAAVEPRGGGATIQPIPMHSDIASRVSTSRETVARVLNDLARKGIVERRRDALLISDVNRLRRMVEAVRG